MKSNSIEPKTLLKGILQTEFIKEGIKPYEPTDGTLPMVISPIVGRIHAEYPHLLSPASFIVDDGMPIIKSKTDPAAKAEEEFQEKWRRLKSFAQICEKHGVRGKFSVIPYVEIDQLGMMDKITDPDAKKMLADYRDYIQKAIMPRFDLTPEINTHGRVLNLETDRPYSDDFVKAHAEFNHESEWSKTQTFESLTDYLTRALTALKNVGLEATGVTGPGNFGIGNEENFAPAVAAALKKVFGQKHAWYFMDTPAATKIEQKLMMFNWTASEYLVSFMAVSDIIDLIVREFVPKGDWARFADVYITEDGKSGVLPHILQNGGECVFCSHWWFFNDDGRPYDTIFSRMEEHYPGRFIWMKSSELSLYTAVSETFRQNMGHHGRWTLQSALECPGFTISFEVIGKIREICINDVPLKRDTSGERRLETGFWRQDGHRVYACFDLTKLTKLALETEL